MQANKHIETFWQHWQGERPEKSLVEQINKALKESLYTSGLIKLKALESLDGLVTENKVYRVLLKKDEHFPEGEECILADNQEDYITLTCFKKEFL
ncbi:MAG: hypothetical protein H7A25_14325 [Leptospiraceae bacterium]|nr:hypothetical protein [Leptospiraceae bacterium]MCP5501080.1 hypothetical protein [Leptospiraceae bacterium]